MKVVFFMLAFMGSLVSCRSAAIEYITPMKDKDVIRLVKNKDVKGVEAALKNGADVNTADGNKRQTV